MKAIGQISVAVAEIDRAWACDPGSRRRRAPGFFDLAEERLMLDRLWMAFLRDPGGNLLVLMSEIRP